MLIATLMQAAAAAVTQPPTPTPGIAGLTGMITGATALVSSLAALGTAIRSAVRSRAAAESARKADVRATAAESRASTALEWADRQANAHRDGVVLVLSYPGATAPCRGLLEANGWRVAHYPVTQAEVDRGAFLPGPHVIDDVRAADALVIEGLDESGVAKLAGMRDFRDNIRSGASVALYTAGRNYRYDLTLWGECDQGVNVPVTAEAAVRASLARREVIARRQGIRPGQVAAARAGLIAGHA